MTVPIFIGMDCAIVGGVACYDPNEHIALVTELKGTPLNHLQQINALLILLKGWSLRDKVFVFETLVHFRNAVTVRSLLERTGFLKWSLTGVGFETYDVDPNTARKFLGTGTKEATLKFFAPNFKGSFLTNNHTDALAIALYKANMDGYTPNFKQLKVERLP
jgi:hypothetical protein